MDEIVPKEGDFFAGVLLETCREDDRSITRPRVRPVEQLPQWLRVEFPRELRDNNPIQTQFRADVHVRQKHLPDGSPNGKLYLRAENKSIRKVTQHPPAAFIKAIRRQDTIHGKAYEYEQVVSQPSPQGSFDELRNAALVAAVNEAPVSRSQTWRRERSKAIRMYALHRSSGICEGCEKPAPFLALNGQPYLEVHHIRALANGGSDHPSNVAAVCPNCHTRVTRGKDSTVYNIHIMSRVRLIEDGLDKDI